MHNKEHVFAFYVNICISLIHPPGIYYQFKLTLNSLMVKGLQTSKYNSSPLTGQIVKLEPLLRANTFASNDLKVFVHK